MINGIPIASVHRTSDEPLIRPAARLAHGASLPAAITAAALLVRMFHLGAKSFWLDEATSVMLARLDWSAAVHAEINAVLYYRLLGLWLRLGDGEAVIRSFSALWSAATVPLVYLLGRRLYGRREGIVAALLLAANAFHVAYAQEARGYSLAVFLVSLSSLLFVENLRHRSATRWAAYVAVSALAIYSHIFAIFMLPAHALSLVFLRPREVPWKGVITSLSAAALLAVPGAVLLSTSTVRPPGWIPEIGARDMYALFESLAGLAGPALLIVYGSACVATIVRAGRVWAAEEISRASWRHAFPLAWLLVPVVIAYGLSMYTPVLPRYLVICLPALALLAAAGLSQIRSRGILAAALAVTMVLAMSRVSTYFCCAQKEDWRGVARLVLSEAHSGDTIIFYSPYIQPAFDYYRDRGISGRPAPALRVVTDPDSVRPAEERVWLIISHDETVGHTASASLKQALAVRFRPPQGWSFAGVGVSLYSR